MKKLLAILLVLVMALGMLPFAASADATEIEIFPYSDTLKGWENWSGATQLYVCTNNSEATVTDDSVFEITLNDGTTSKTITATRSSSYSFGATSYTINRFTVCLFEGENQFIPAVNAAYSISVKIYNDGELAYTAPETEGWYNAFEPIVPEPAPEPEGPVAIKIFPKFGKWENWINSPNNPNNVPGATDEEKQPGVTQLLVGISDANDAKIDIDAALTWKVTISAGDESKTITMAPATKALDYNLYRFETCLGEGENQFIPVNGTDYTVQITVLGEDGEELYKSEAVSGFVCPMDPVVPETPVEPQPPVVEPPVAGDATVMIAVLAVVALFGAAVVTKKVFVK